MSCMYSHASGVALDAALEQRDRQIGPAGPERIRLGQEDRAKAVRDLELRIERRHEVSRG